MQCGKNDYYQKINRFKIKIAEKWCYSYDIGFFFLCNVVWSLLVNIAQSFCLCNVVSKSITKLLSRILSYEMFSEGSWTTRFTQDFYLRNVVPRLLRQHWAGFIPGFYWMFFVVALGQHCTRFLPVQYCLKSIKATLNRVLFLCNVV